MSATPVEKTPRLKICAKAWRTALRVMTESGVDEAAGDAVWLDVSKRRARLLLGDQQGMMSIAGGTANVNRLHVRLSPRFVVAVANWVSYQGYSDDYDVAVELVDGGTTAVFTDGAMRVAIDVLPAQQFTGLDAPEFHAATAVVEGEAFRFVVAHVQKPPSGIGDVKYRDCPLWVGVSHSMGLSFTVDWRRTDLGRTTYRVDADTTMHNAPVDSSAGDTVARAIMSANFGWYADAVARDEQVTIEFPDDITGVVVLRTADWWATVPCYDPLAQRWNGELAEHLDTAGFEYHLDTERVTIIDSTDKPVRLELLGGEAHMVRLSMVLDRGIRSTPAVLAEINQANMSLLGTRVWLDDGRLVVGSELPFTRLEDVAESVFALEYQVAGLDVFLGALSALEFEEIDH